jgi:hypothetical protein
MHTQPAADRVLPAREFRARVLAEAASAVAAAAEAFEAAGEGAFAAAEAEEASAVVAPSLRP